MKRTGFYASLGPSLIHYEVDLDGLALIQRESIELPANVQYAWPHASRPILYATASSQASRENPGSEHSLCALAIDAAGKLSLHGAAVKLPRRAIHITTDRACEHLLVAFSRPAEMQVYRINPDGTLGERLPQRDGLDWGHLPHQVRVSDDGELAILLTRGNPARRGVHSAREAQTDAGALKVFQYRDGRLGEESSVAPGDGRRFGPRALDFHPTAPWVFVSLQMQNRLQVFRREGRRILSEPLFERELLPDPEKAERTPTYQRGGEVHVHPNGSFVYCVNRADVPGEYQGRKMLVDPDNSFVVFALDESTGEPTLIQRIDTMGIEPRCFSLHPSGRMLVAANGETHLVKQGERVGEVCANLAVFEIRDDGRLRFVRKYEVPVTLTNYSPDSGNFGSDELYWGGFVEY